MSFRFVETGAGNASAYMMAGTPWITASSCGTTPKREAFDFVTRNIVVHVTGTNESCRIGFSRNGLTANNCYMTLGVNDSISMGIRATELFIMSLGGVATYEIYAELTPIRSRDFGVYSGSVNNLTDVNQILANVG